MRFFVRGKILQAWAELISRLSDYHKRMQHSGFQHELSDRCDPALISILRLQTPAQKLAVLDAMWRSARTLVAAGVRAQHPNWSEANLAQEVAARMSHGAVGRA